MYVPSEMVRQSVMEHVYGHLVGLAIALDSASRRTNAQTFPVGSNELRGHLVVVGGSTELAAAGATDGREVSPVC